MTEPAQAFDLPLDWLYADIAIRIQLSATAHGKAVQRYETIADRLDRDDSPFKGLIDLFYPQGSMAIGAAIASGVTNDDFDLDMVLQARCGWWTPKEVLDRLFEAINGKPGSRYYGRARRRSRCVTIEYSGMHIDVTPAERLPATPERQSNIFHHRAPEDPGAADHRQPLRLRGVVHSEDAGQRLRGTVRQPGASLRSVAPRRSGGC